MERRCRVLTGGRLTSARIVIGRGRSERLALRSGGTTGITGNCQIGVLPTGGRGASWVAAGLARRVVIVADKEGQWVTLVVRVTPAQHAKLVEQAKLRDRSVAWIVRSLIDRLSVGTSDGR